MDRRQVVTAVLATIAIGGLSLAVAAIPKAIELSVADKARPAADREADPRRRPEAMLAFAELKPGDKVADLLPGGGYFTRLFSGVVGPKGHVYAVAPPKRPEAAADAPDPAADVKAIASSEHYRNVSVLSQRVSQLALPERVNAVWTSLNYHDVHNAPGVDVKDFNRRVFESLVPGGVYIVVDHSAKTGTGLRDTSTLHRIDESAVKAEVLAAGFQFVSSNDALRNPQDNRDLTVFDSKIRGQTDQFALKFRRPK